MLFLQNNIKSLKHCLNSAAKFAGDLFSCYPDATQLQVSLKNPFPVVTDTKQECLSLTSLFSPSHII